MVIPDYDPTLSTVDRGLGAYNIILAYRGSVAHGMYIPNTDPHSVDDIDLIGVVIPPIDHYFGLRHYANDGTKEIKQGKWDVVIYEARKAVRLLSKGNPNILSLLWSDAEHYINVSREGQMLIDSRLLFLTNEISGSFYGYARAQMHKMEHGAYNGFMGEKRKQLVDKFGYDCKNASHLIRLLRMGAEALEAGELNVNRANIDAQELLAIKTGQYTLEQVKAMASDLFVRLERARKVSVLPNKPDARMIDDLLTEMIAARMRYYAQVGVE